MAFVRGGGYHLRSELPKLIVETLVLWGCNDKHANPKCAENYTRNIHQCQVVWIDRCGHWAALSSQQRLPGSC